MTKQLEKQLEFEFMIEEHKAENREVIKDIIWGSIGLGTVVSVAVALYGFGWPVEKLSVYISEALNYIPNF